MLGLDGALTQPNTGDGGQWIDRSSPIICITCLNDGNAFVGFSIGLKTSLQTPNRLCMLIIWFETVYPLNHLLHLLLGKLMMRQHGNLAPHTR